MEATGLADEFVSKTESEESRSASRVMRSTLFSLSRLRILAYANEFSESGSDFH